MSQAHDLHRALLRPAVIQILRAAGFHSTKPAVLDTVINLSERFLLLLAASSASHAQLSHNDSIPTISDVRMALMDAGVLHPQTDAAEEAWQERLRKPLAEIAVSGRSDEGGRLRLHAQKRKRDEEDTRDVREFVRWYEGGVHREVRRVAGMMGSEMENKMVGVGGGVVVAEDFLQGLKKKQAGGKTGDESRLRGTVLSKEVEDREVVIEGGKVARIREWRPNVGERKEEVEEEEEDEESELSSIAGDIDMLEE